MKDLTITAIIKVYQYDELNEGDRSLIKTAMEATARSYSPYSHFSVGAAALLGNGTVVTGTNQEKCGLSVGALCRTYYPILCQLPISRPTGCHSCHCGTNGKGLHRPSDSSLRCLPASDSGNGKALQTTHPHPIIWQRMYLRSKKYRRSTAVII